MGSERSFPLSSLLVIALLAVIAVMLIAPDVDPPDTAFHGNAAPVVVYRHLQHAPQGNQQSRTFDIHSKPSGNADICCVRHSRAGELVLPFVSHQILRC